MKLMTMIYNELPFMVELEDGLYKVKMDNKEIELKLSSNYFELLVAPFTKFADRVYAYGDEETLIDGFQAPSWRKLQLH